MRVTLRKRLTKTGKISLYLDHYPPVIHPESGKLTRWEYLNMFLYSPPRDEVEKRHNRDIETLAKSIAAARQLDRLAGKFGIKRSAQFDDFLPFYEKLVSKWAGKSSTHGGWVASYKTFLIFCKGKCSFGDITPQFINEYKEFLTKKATRIHSPEMRITLNSCYTYYNKLRAAVREAMVFGYMPNNPFDAVKGIPQPETYREFLTKEELITMFNTPCDSALLKRTCMFSALTGLRLGDVMKLKWNQIQYSESMGHFIRFTQSKTQGMETLPISDEAYELLGEVTTPDEFVFGDYDFRREYAILQRWLQAAGVRKKITFHNFRHTFATLQLAEGTDIYTVSKLLGHKHIHTTQIYGKVMDTTKTKAMKSIKLGIKTDKKDKD
jgi:integrase